MPCVNCRQYFKVCNCTYSRDMPDGELKEDAVQCYKHGNEALATCYICPLNSTVLVTVMPDFVCGNSRLKRDTVTDFWYALPINIFSTMRLAWLKWSCVPFVPRCSCIDKVTNMKMAVDHSTGLPLDIA